MVDVQKVFTKSTTYMKEPKKKKNNTVSGHFGNCSCLVNCLSEVPEKNPFFSALPRVATGQLATEAVSYPALTSLHLTKTTRNIDIING